MQNSKPNNCDNLPAHVLNRPTPAPISKESTKPIYRPLTAEEGIQYCLYNTIRALYPIKPILIFTTACTGKRKSRLQSEIVEFFKENLAAFLINKTANNPNRLVSKTKYLLLHLYELIIIMCYAVLLVRIIIFHQKSEWLNGNFCNWMQIKTTSSTDKRLENWDCSLKEAKSYGGVAKNCQPFVTPTETSGLRPMSGFNVSVSSKVYSNYLLS